MGLTKSTVSGAAGGVGAKGEGDPTTATGKGGGTGDADGGGKGASDGGGVSDGGDIVIGTE